MTDMKPILFSTDMVKAILEDRKTKTRRALKLPNWSTGKREDVEIDGNTVSVICQNTGCLAEIKPLYKVGDILWVRETWNSIRFGNGVKVPYSTSYWYKADDKSNNADDKWRPSIHMPKAAARLFLKVTDIQVEHLNDITEEDAKAEGVLKALWYRPYGLKMTDKHLGETSDCGFFGANYRTGFAHLWDRLCEKSKDWQHKWENNPFAWVISFEKVEKPEGM